MISINPTEAELLNVLIVEDDPDDVYVLERAVSRAVLDGGWRLRLQVVGNGLEAINFVTWHDVVNDLPDIVILDLNMPVIDGVGFLKSLRNSLDFRDLRVVVLTTSADRTIHRTALDAGADAVFVKPDSRDALDGIARSIIAMSPRRGGEARRGEHGGAHEALHPARSGDPIIRTDAIGDGPAAGTSVIELVSLRLREGVAEAEFLDAVEAATAFLKSCPGFIRRRLAKGAEDEWVDYLEWETRDAARAAASLGRSASGMRAFLRAIDDRSLDRRKLTVHSVVN
jgi:Response regulator containing CheY-like receiver domain and AraC-type DNA-binding domain